jgi:hypothetical protein
VLGAHIKHDAEPEPDRRRRVAGPEHQRIPDGLDLVGVMGGQQPPHGHTEPADQVGGLLVPMGLGQGGEAREVRKQERLHGRLRTLHHRSPEPTSNRPARAARLLLVRAGSAAGDHYTSLRLPSPT